VDELAAKLASWRVSLRRRPCLSVHETKIETVALGYNNHTHTFVGRDCGFPILLVHFLRSEHDLSNVIDAHFTKYRKSPFTPPNVKTLLIHLVRAVDFLHSRHMIHRDIKMSNLLYTDAGRLKLADFGLSRPYADSLQSQLTPQVASLWYRPPELLLGATSYTTALDLWAVGCIAGELATGQPLMNGSSELDQIHKVLDCIGLPSPTLDFFWKLPLIRSGKVTLPKKSSRRLLDLLGNQFTQKGLELVHSLLQIDPEQRWTASQALASDYFGESPLPTPTNNMPRFPRSFQS